MEFQRFLFDKNISEEKPVVAMFHTNNPDEEEEFDLMQSQFIQIAFIKVNTQEATAIKEKYSDGYSKPSFKIYKNNKETDYVRHEKWSMQEPRLRSLLEEYSINKYKGIEIVGELSTLE